MDNFIVSARKYRPATFDSVVGQKHITTTLKNAIRNRQLAQAFLFTGPRGVGKTTCARILAKTINCMQLGENIEACDQCESCVSFNQNASFNIHELDAASNNSVDDIRNLVDQVRIPPQVGSYKVYIIDEVHMLSQSAFNAFLKTLEEPPAYAKFILATTEKHKIIPTILSRCQIYDFKRIDVKDIAEYLAYVAGKEDIATEPEALQVIAQKADGALRDALSMFDQLVSFAGRELSYSLVAENLNVLDYDYYFSITDYLLEGKVFDTLMVLDKIIESGFDGQHFISGLGSHFRDLLVCQDEKTIGLLEVGVRIKEKYLEQSQKCSRQFLIKALDVVQKADFSYKGSNNKRLHLEIALMRIATLNDNPAKAGPPLATSKKKVDPVTPKTNPAPTQQPSKSSETAADQVKEPAPPVSAKATPKPSADKRAGVFPGTISIKEDIDEEEEPETEQEEVFDRDSEDFKNARKIDQEQLNELWKSYAGRLNTQKPNLASTLMAAQPKADENFEIHFEVNNTVQQKEIEDEKTQMLDFLREKLGNRFIRILTVVNSEMNHSKPCTPEDIYKHFNGKNPAVGQLKNRFGLDLER